MYNKFEKGVTYYNLFKGDMSIWAEQVQKFRITTAQLISGLSNPTTLVPAIPGFALIPTSLVINKPAGGNCAVGATTSLGVYWRGSSVNAVPLTSPAVNSFTTTDNVLYYATGLSNGSALYAGVTTVNPAGDQYGNRDLVFATQGADLTVSSGSPTLTLLLTWRQIPLVLPLA